LSVMEDWLAERGVALPDAYAEFMMWNWRLGRYERGPLYRSVVKDSWPSAFRNTEVLAESCKLNTDGGNPFYLPAMGGDYVTLSFPGARPRTGVLRVTAPPNVTVDAIVTRGATRTEQRLEFDDAGLSTMTDWFGRTGIEKIVLVMTNGQPQGPSSTVTYSVQLDGGNDVSATPPAGTTLTSAGSSAGLSGQIYCNGAGAPTTTGRLIAIDEVTTQRTEFPFTTNPAGGWSLGIFPGRKTRYFVEVDDPWMSDATSGSSVVLVSVFVTLEVQSASVVLGSPVRMDGAVIPAHEGAKVLLEFRRPAGLWRSSHTVLTSDTGAYTGDIVLPRKGVWEVRTTVTDTGDDDHEPSISVPRVVQVIP
jgi:hypothetical protein